MLRFQVTGHRPRAPPHLRASLNGIKQQRERVRDSLSADVRVRTHALDEMRHWRDPEEQRLLTLRRRQYTLIDDNPSSG